MNITLSKLSLIAGICLLAAGTNQAYSQGCNTGYGGGVYFDNCTPSSSAADYTYYGGSYNDSRCDDTYYAPRRNRSYQRPVYNVSNQVGCQCPDCVGGGSAANYSSGRSISERLSYIETILAYIVNFLGLDSSPGGSSSDSGQISPRYSSRAPQGDCAGGS